MVGGDVGSRPRQLFFLLKRKNVRIPMVVVFVHVGKIKRRFLSLEKKKQYWCSVSVCVWKKKKLFWSR